MRTPGNSLRTQQLAANRHQPLTAPYPPFAVRESIFARLLAGTPCPHLLAGPSRNFRPHPATFFGRGAVDAIAAACAAAPPRRVFVNAQLTGVQQRTLELALHRSVLDRVALIIEIFSQRARTKEARLQVGVQCVCGLFCWSLHAWKVLDLNVLQ